jgi:hypothetical protein
VFGAFFFNCLENHEILREQLTEFKIYVPFFFTNFIRNNFREETHVDFCVKYQLFFSDFNENLKLYTNFSKLPNIKFYWNPFNVLNLLYADREIYKVVDKQSEVSITCIIDSFLQLFL